MENSPERSVVSPPTETRLWFTEREEEGGETARLVLERRLKPVGGSLGSQ